MSSFYDIYCISEYIESRGTRAISSPSFQHLVIIGPEFYFSLDFDLNSSKFSIK